MSEEPSELAERGEEIFERVVRPQLENRSDIDDRDYVAIDVDSEDFEIDADQRAASDRLLERHPGARGRIWFRRVGSRVTHHFGGRFLSDAFD
ncbi:MAG: hypothetical protein ABEL04_12785 [Salinibacter sp.]|uniref:hypothetical protein n=1 Tax=Salinibacter sp. TaxID=2065818 RepID=UPI0035D5115C